MFARPTRMLAVDDDQGKTLMNTATSQEPQVDFAIIEQRARAGERLCTKKLAQEFSITSAKMRTALITHFGKRITFQRGRTGGIRIAQ